jgi:hypothetical protein
MTGVITQSKEKIAALLDPAKIKWFRLSIAGESSEIPLQTTMASSRASGS